MTVTDESPVSTAVGRCVREFRRSRNWTQSDLASRVNRTAVTVSAWETGHTRLDVDLLVAVAAALEVSPMALLPGPLLTLDGLVTSPTPWRVGRHVGRTLYTCSDPDRPEGRLIGLMDTVADAALVVSAINARLAP